MRLTFISDTHGQHHKVKLLPGDVLLHCGDVSKFGSKRDIVSFYEWFVRQPFRHKIFIVGNQDAPFDRELSHIKLWVPPSVHYLENSGVVLDGVRFWGSPMTPRFASTAFTTSSPEQIRPYWDMIPGDTDVLLTHGPALGTGDANIHGVASGCPELRAALANSAVKVHAYGHIHEAHGVHGSAPLSLNASVLDRGYRHRNPPLTVLYQDGKFTLTHD